MVKGQDNLGTIELYSCFWKPVEGRQFEGLVQISSYIADIMVKIME